MRIFLFSALVALAASQRFRRTPTTISTSTYGTSPIVSGTSVPSLSAIATLSASPSGSRSSRVSSSSLPSVSVSRSPRLSPSSRSSVSESRSARVSSSQTSTARLSSEPSRSYLATGSPMFSVSVTTSTSASVTSTPSVSPSITSTPCALWYKKIFPDYQPCNPTGSQTIHGANAASTALMAVLTFVSLILIILTFVMIYSDENFVIQESDSNRPITHCIAFTFSIPCCFLPLILIIMFGKTEGYDQTPYKIASGVLLCSWIFFVFCFVPIIIFIEYCCVEIYKAYQRDRDWWIQWIAERQRPRVLDHNPPPIVEHPPTIANPPIKVFVNTDPTCTICFANMPEKGELTTDKEEERTTLACGHEFHSGCVSSWHAQRLAEHPSEPASCPICRANLQGASGDAK